jgi:ankyrin repeat protein
MLLAQIKGGFTALHLAAHANHVHIIQKLWICAEECKLNPTEFKKKLLLAKDKRGKTAWHIAAKEGNLEAFESLRIWGKETGLDPNDMLLA